MNEEKQTHLCDIVSDVISPPSRQRTCLAALKLQSRRAEECAGEAEADGRDEGGKKKQTQEGKRKRRNERQERRITGSGGAGRGRGTAVRIEQVCRGEIRVLQVSLQDCYIDLRGSKTKRCAESFITGSRRVDIISNAVVALYYEAIIPNTCRHAHAHTRYIVEYNEALCFTLQPPHHPNTHTHTKVFPLFFSFCLLLNK